MPVGSRTTLAMVAGLVVAIIAGGTSCAPADVAASAHPRSDPAVTRGGTLRFLSQPPASLDPPSLDSVYESFPVAQIFDGLVAADTGLRVIPRLADVWTVSRDGRVYRFHLRDGVRFHDGSPLSADDVVFSFRRALDPRRPVRSVVEPYLASVSGVRDYAAGRRADLPGITAVDDRTVEFRLDHPHPSFLDVLTFDGLRVVPRRVVERIGDAAFGRNPVGTGPFRLASWDASGITLDANRDYFQGSPFLDAVRIEFPASGEDDNGAARFLRGDLDVVDPRGTSLAAFEGRPDIRLTRQPELSVWFLGMNTAVPGLDDVRVRRAIAHAVDREALAALAPSTRRAAEGLLPPGLQGYSPDPKVVPFDPATARRLLAEAGHPDGKGLPAFDLYVARDSVFANGSAARIAEDLARIGIACVVYEVDWSELSRRVDDHAAPLFLIGWVADLADPDGFLRALVVSEGSANFFLFNDAAVASLLDAGIREPNPVARAAIYRDLETRVLAEAPLVPLFHSLGLIARRSAVHGFEPGPLGWSCVDLRRVWIEKGRG